MDIPGSDGVVYMWQLYRQIYLEDIPGSDGVVFIARKHDSSTVSEVQGGSPKHDTWFGVKLDFLVSSEVVQVDLQEIE